MSPEFEAFLTSRSYIRILYMIVIKLLFYFQPVSPSHNLAQAHEATDNDINEVGALPTQIADDKVYYFFFVFSFFVLLFTSRPFLVNAFGTYINLFLGDF